MLMQKIFVIAQAGAESVFWLLVLSTKVFSRANIIIIVKSGKKEAVVFMSMDGIRREVNKNAETVPRKNRIAGL